MTKKRRACSPVSKEKEKNHKQNRMLISCDIRNANLSQMLEEERQAEQPILINDQHEGFFTLTNCRDSESHGLLSLLKYICYLGFIHLKTGRKQSSLDRNTKWTKRRFKPSQYNVASKWIFLSFAFSRMPSVFYGDCKIHHLFKKKQSKEATWTLQQAKSWKPSSAQKSNAATIYSVIFYSFLCLLFCCTQN